MTLTRALGYGGVLLLCYPIYQNGGSEAVACWLGAVGIALGSFRAFTEHLEREWSE